MSSNRSYLPAIVAAAGLVGGAYCAYNIYQANKKKLPENWVKVGTLKDIFTYPIKSCGPVKIQEAECTFMGLKNDFLRDRVFMIVDTKKNFISARVYPDMLLVHPSFRGSILTLTHQDFKPISVNIAEVVSTKATGTATVWGVPVPVYDCGEAVGEWFSKLLSMDGLRMVYYASDKCRKIRDKTNTVLFRFTKNDTGALPDETSFNLINDASVDDLNTRLEHNVTPLQFRPNFVIKGAEPLDEDNWKYVKIGGNVFEIIKPCGRCVLTTIDPETGIRNNKAEPLETLRSYRLPEDLEVRKAMSSAPRMGVQMALRTPPGSMVKIDDPVSVAY